MENTTISRLSVEHGQYAAHEVVGLLVSCKCDGLESRFRCLMNKSDLDKFYDAIQKYVSDYSIDKNISLIRRNSFESVNDNATPHSAMRSSVTSAMDHFDSSTRKKFIMKRRGALKWMPPLFANDLVHGSWWFAIGSVVMFLMSVFVFINEYYVYIGEDDATLAPLHSRVCWAMMALSGLFFSLGSFAFIRATHESPPMKPLFSWYHLQNDELLASWLFLFATFPFVPYLLIYLVTSESKLLYIGALIALFFTIAGSFMFVLACYPTRGSKEKREYILPLLKLFVWMCYSERFIKLHLANDWLAGTWLIFWGSLLATLASLAIISWAHNTLQMFMYITGFIDNVFFLIGSAYFVAGSYPEQHEGSIDGDENEGDIESIGQDIAGEDQTDDEDEPEQDRIAQDSRPLRWEQSSEGDPNVPELPELVVSASNLSVAGLRWKQQLSAVHIENKKMLTRLSQGARLVASSAGLAQEASRIECSLGEVATAAVEWSRKTALVEASLQCEISSVDKVIGDIISLKLSSIDVVVETEEARRRCNTAKSKYCRLAGASIITASAGEDIDMCRRE